MERTLVLLYLGFAALNIKVPKFILSFDTSIEIQYLCTIEPVDTYLVIHFFVGFGENHRITAPSQGGVEGSVRPLLNKNPTRSFSCPT